MITKMNKYSFLIYHKEYETFLDKLRALGVVHVEICQTGEVDENLQALLQKHTSYKNLYKEMSLAASLAEGQSAVSVVTIEQTIEGYEALRDRLQALTQQLPALDKEIAQMEVWGEFDWKVIDDLKNNGWLMQFFCCPEKTFDEAWIESYNATVINKKAGQAYFVTLTKEAIKIEAEAVRLPEYKLSELEAKRTSLLTEIESVKNQLQAFCASHLLVVETAMSQLQGDIDLLEVKLGGEKKADGALVLLEGWVPDENDAAVRSMLETSGVYYESRPAEKEDNAPIKLKNNAITRLFELLTKMYGMPEYGEFDPTPLFAPFYALFFGMCVGDAGYGLLLVLLGLYLKKKLSESMAGLMNLLITLGAATTIVGAVFNTFFGATLTSFDLPAWMQSLIITGDWEGTTYNKTMVIALLVGMFHICFAMTVKAISSTVRYGFKNSLSNWGWWLFVCGSVVVATLNYLGVIDMEMSKMAFVGIGGVSAIGIYLLNNIRRNVFMNIGAGLWDTYNMATGLMGDLLSYLRLYALGLAGGMLGGVFNDLCMQLRDSMGDILFGIPGWICFALIFVAGHSLNIALSCLSGYVHSIRLTFVEYFKNSGYNGKGTSYKPFSFIQNKK
ncbi:MAG: V-type ATPase 116kDa subunit family protein [Parabacteroides sp.]|nr:V-type ATPase 116kDa subunit family protein [Parabacteroides sp.]